MKRHYLLGIPVDAIGPDEVYQKILDLSELGRPARVILLDTYLLLRAQFSSKIYKIIKTADLVIPISPGIKMGLKFKKIKIDKIYNYYNLLINLLLLFTDEKKFIYVLGGKKKFIHTVEKNIRDSFPGIRIVGRFHINYKKTFEPKLITAIQKASPSLVLVGNSSPKQEKWIYNRMNKFSQGVFIGVGDFVNIIGGMGASPSEKSIQSGSYGLKKTISHPLRIFRILLYSLYLPLLLLSLIFKRK